MQKTNNSPACVCERKFGEKLFQSRILGNNLSEEMSELWVYLGYIVPWEVWASAKAEEINHRKDSDQGDTASKWGQRDSLGSKDLVMIFIIYS